MAAFSSLRFLYRYAAYCSTSIPSCSAPASSFMPSSEMAFLARPITFRRYSSYAPALIYRSVFRISRMFSSVMAPSPFLFIHRHHCHCQFHQPSRCACPVQMKRLLSEPYFRHWSLQTPLQSRVSHHTGQSP